MPDRYRLIVEAAPHGALLVDAGGRIALANAQCALMFGFEQDALIGEPIEVLVPSEARTGHRSLRTAYLGDPVSRIMGGGRELMAQRRDGTRFPVEIGLNVLADGTDTFILASVIDISERVSAAQALRAADERFRQLAESIDEVFWLTDLGKSEMVYVSPGYERLWGRSVGLCIRHRARGSTPCIPTIACACSARCPVRFRATTTSNIASCVRTAPCGGFATARFS